MDDVPRAVSRYEEKSSSRAINIRAHKRKGACEASVEISRQRHTLVFFSGSGIIHEQHTEQDGRKNNENVIKHNCFASH